MKNEKEQIREKNSPMLIVFIGSGGKVLLKILPVDHSLVLMMASPISTVIFPKSETNTFRFDQYLCSEEGFHNIYASFFPWGEDIYHSESLHDH